MSVRELHFWLSGSGALQDGTRFELQWKAERVERDAPLRWEMRRVLPSLNFPITESVSVANRIRDQRHAWETTWASLGFSTAPGVMWGPSVNMLRGRGHGGTLEKRSVAALVLHARTLEFVVSLAGSWLEEGQG